MVKCIQIVPCMTDYRNAEDYQKLLTNYDGADDQSSSVPF